MAILSEVKGGVMRIRFDRADKKNALTAAMYSALADALDAAEADPAVRVTLISGTPGTFTAGNDIEDFLRTPPLTLDAPVFRFLMRLPTLTKPLVAEVTGVAVGVGTTMLLHCDLVYAADNARFSLPFVSLGLLPEAGSSLLLPRLSGYQRAAEKLLLGEPFDVVEAREMGLVTRAVPAAELSALVETQLAKLVALPAAALRESKRLMKGDDIAALQARIREEARAFAIRLQSPEAKEAFTAFLERRKPDFGKFG